VNVPEIVNVVEAAGVAFRLDGKKVRVWYPGEQQREELASQVAFLRAHREETAAFLQTRPVIPAMPPGVRLVSWKLKEPPVEIEYHAVVIDPAKFASATLDELRVRLTNPKRKYGWTVPQLIDRLGQVGVAVVVEPPESAEPPDAGVARGS